MRVVTMLKNRLLFLSILVIVTLFCSVTSFLAGRLWQYSIDSHDIVSAVALRLDIEPSWNAVRGYVYCDVLKNDAKRDDVEARLLQVSPFTESENSTYHYITIVFDDPFMRAELSDLTLWFDEKDQLKGKFKGTNLSQIAIECP